MRLLKQAREEFDRMVDNQAHRDMVRERAKNVKAIQKRQQGTKRAQRQSGK